MFRPSLGESQASREKDDREGDHSDNALQTGAKFKAERPKHSERLRKKRLNGVNLKREGRDW